MDANQSGMERKSKLFLFFFFLSICVSVGLTYYHTVILKDYVIFTNPDAVPNSSDFIVYLVNFFQ